MAATSVLPDLERARLTTSTEETRRAAWIAELAAMDNAVIEINRALDDAEDKRPDPAAWTPGAELGPIPEDLADYAFRVNRAQAQALDRLARARLEAGRHLAVLRTLPSGDRAGHRTLDITG